MFTSIVYQGFYIDRSQERVTKKYLLTLSDTHGGYLNNFLAFYITEIVATASWAVVSFLLHQSCHRGHKHDIRSLLIVTLRNLTNAGVFLLLLPVIWNTPSKSLRSTFFNILIVFAAFAHWAAWLSASVFLSRIQLNNLVLASSHHCGYRGPIRGDTVAFGTFHANKARVARSYVASCGGGQHSPGCIKLITSSFPIWQMHNLPCPFSTSLCPSGNSAFGLRTDHISSFEIGLNLPDGHFTVKRQMTCSPIRIQNGTAARNYYMKDNPTIAQYFDRIDKYNKSITRDPTLESNVADLKISGSYYIDALKYPPIHSEKGSIPIPGLINNASDTVLYILGLNGIFYPSPQRDLWFHADVSTGNSTELYYSSTPFSFLACQEEVQYCNTRNGICSPMQSTTAPITTNATLAWTENQIAGLGVYEQASSSFFPLQQSVVVQGASSLLASDLLYQQRSTDLNPEQWKLEVTNWFRTSLAGVSIALVDWATGANKDFPGVELVVNPQTDKVCRKHWVIFRSIAGYKTFSVVGIVIVILVGIFLIVASKLIVTLWEKYRLGSQVSRLAWKNDHIFELSRRANDMQGGSSLRTQAYNRRT